MKSIINIEYIFRENMKLIIESVDKNKELFTFISLSLINNYKTFYNILLNMKKPFSSVSIENLVVLEYIFIISFRNSRVYIRIE